MQHESSITHRQNLANGLTVKWERFTGHTDSDWSVVCYDDESRWLFTNSDAEQIRLLGEVSDGLNKSEILTSETGAIIALYSGYPEVFESGEAWIDSLPDADKQEAETVLMTA